MTSNVEPPRVDRDRLLGQQYWLIWWQPLPSTTTADIDASLDEHLRWLLDLEEQQVIVLSGPLTDGPDVGPGSGVTIVRAADQAAARTIAAGDPFVTAGLRLFQVYAWTVNEGAITVRVELGHGRFSWR